MKKSIIFAVLITICTVTFCCAAPSPAIVQSDQQWTVKVKYQHLQQIQVQFKGRKHPSRFWYLILTVENDTASDVDFFPKCELMTDTLKITPSGQNVPPAVFDLLKRRHQQQYPFLEYIENTSSKILQGKDNIKDIAIIWPDFDLQAKNISIFIAGLSNETIILDHPDEKDENGNPKKIFLRKTLQIDYSIAGDPKFRNDAVIEFKQQDWIMR